MIVDDEQRCEQKALAICEEMKACKEDTGATELEKLQKC
jgi:hypothetical protein